ncbi:MAG: helix-turn-helix transcriptional regulator [Bryobacteraceae bacterium]|jgi:predicted DNA-binding transcriptional regulator AlpA
MAVVKPVPPSITENAGVPTRIAPAYLRLRAAADYLSVTQQYLNKMERMGQGPRRIKKGRMTFYAVADLDTWMRGSEEQAA